MIIINFEYVHLVTNIPASKLYFWSLILYPLQIMKNTFVGLLSLALFASCGGNQDVKEEKKVSLNQEVAQEAESLLTRAQNYFGPLPKEAPSATNPLSPEKIALGKKLFFDKRLSKDGTISCNSCHNLDTYGVDNLATSPGDEGKNGARNSPTVMNAAFHIAQFWDGRAADVEEQAGGPILNPIEMNIPSEEFMEKRLSQIPEYKSLFAKAFPNTKGISYDNLQNAIGAFERTLITPSKFDNYIVGGESALNDDEKKGLELFINTGCITCHNGPLFGGNQYQKFGLFGNYWELTGSNPIDMGIFTESGSESDKYFFKVPSLRNIEKTYPYFHDGSVSDLNKAVIIMAKLQNNKKLSEADAASIVTFLATLTGEVSSKMK